MLTLKSSMSSSKQDPVVFFCERCLSLYWHQALVFCMALLTKPNTSVTKASLSVVEGICCMKRLDNSTSYRPSRISILSERCRTVAPSSSFAPSMASLEKLPLSSRRLLKTPIRVHFATEETTLFLIFSSGLVFQAFSLSVSSAVSCRPRVIGA